MEWPHPDPSIYRPPGIPGPRARVGEIMPGLHQRGLITTSAFLVITPDAETGEEAVTIIDAGWRLYHHRRIIEYLGRLGYGPGSVRQLISTHYHPDHVGGMAGLIEETGAPLAAHGVEAPYLAGEAGRKLPNPVKPRWLRPFMWPLLTWMTPPPVPVASRLNEGDSLPLLGGAIVVHTPGHTPGSISLHFPNEGGTAGRRRPATLPGPSHPALPLVLQRHGGGQGVGPPPVPTGLRDHLLQPLRAYAAGCSRRAPIPGGVGLITFVWIHRMRG